MAESGQIIEFPMRTEVIRFWKYCSGNEDMKLTKKIRLLSCAFLLPLLTVLYPLDQALAQQQSNSGWRMGPGMMGNWGMGGFGMVFMMVFWILVIVGIVFLVKWLIQASSSGKAAQQTGQRAVEILKERYARGEIDKAEFESMKRDIS